MDGKGVACIATSLPSFLFQILLRESNHMCSIIGFCDKRAQYEVVKAALLKTKSRGPDDTRIVDTGNGYLGFNRLAIMGLTDAGMQPFEAEAEAYRTASVCVAPSVIGPSGRQEGIPNVMIEALAYQRPAITTNISGIPELIRDGDTGLLVPPGDPQALADALLRVRNDPKAALAMARRGRAHVAKEFDLAANARRQLALFFLA